MTTDNHSFKSRADIASNICSFFIILQVRSTQEINRKTLCRERNSMRRIGAFNFSTRIG